MSSHFKSTAAHALFAAFSFIVFAMSIARCEEVDNRLEASSYLQAWLANSVAVESYDCVVYYEKFGVAPSGKTVESEQVMRLRAIPREGTFFVARQRKTGVEKDGKQRVKVCHEAFGVNHGKGWMRSCDGKLSLIDDDSIVSVLQLLRVPDMRHVGLLPFPNPFCLVQAESTGGKVKELDFFESTVSEFFSPARNPGVSVGRNRATVKLVTVAGMPSIAQLWEIDTEKMVPVSLKKIYQFESMSKLDFSEDYDWIERQGVYLPSSITGEIVELEVADDRANPYSVLHSAAIEWVSVNEEISDSAMSSAAVSSNEKLLSLLKESTAIIASRIPSTRLSEEESEPK